MLTKIFLFVIIIVFATFSNDSLEHKTNIAVLDFNTNCFTLNEIIGLTNRLNITLFNTGHFNIIERSMIEEILKEQGFQQSGCTNTQCAVEIGQLIGVEKICIGSFDKVGSFISSNARIVDIKTGKIEKMVSVECNNCDIDYVYKNSIYQLIAKIVDGDSTSNNLKEMDDPKPISPKEINENNFVYSNTGLRVNPDGYCGILIPRILFSYYEDNYKYVYDSIYSDLNGKTSASSIMLGLTFPISQIFSLDLKSIYSMNTDNSNWMLSIDIGSSIFTSNLSSLSDLINPDGVVGSFIIVPGAQFDFAKSGLTNFYFYSQIGFVVSEFLTLSCEVDYDRFIDSNENGFEINFIPTIHFKNSHRSDQNADGKIGSINIEPTYGILFYKNGVSQTAFTSILIPFSKNLSGYMSMSFNAGKYDPAGYIYSDNGYKLNIGVKIFPK